jgi:type I restriction enzyme S subunit
MKEGWEYKKLGDLCQVLDSQRKPVTKKDRTKGIYPYYGATGIQDYVDSYIFDGRFLLVGEDGAKWGATDKTAYIIEGKSWVNNHAHILKVLENVDDRLLEYYLTFKDLSEYITGAVVPKLTQKALVSIPIPVPPLSEQQHIVEELDLLRSITEKKKAQLNELDNLAQSLFYEMFGNPISNEKGWDKNVLNEVAKVTSSKRILQSEWQEAGIPFYKVADIVNLINGECVTPLTFIKETTYNELKSNGLVPKANDVLITSRGTIGQCYIVKEHDSFYFQDGMITWLSNINSLISPTFLVALFANDVFSDSLKHSANSSTVAYISIKQLSNMKIPIPPLTLQQQFASKIEAIEHQKELIKQSIKEVETLFNSRMDYYFS